MKLLAALALAVALPHLGGCGKQAKQTGEMIPPGTTSFSVEAKNAPTSYTVNSIENAAITLKRGEKYTFNVNALGHPFYIFFSSGGNVANAYTNGVSGNGVQVGILTFTVPSTAPNVLYYGSSSDPGMFGTLTITD